MNDTLTKIPEKSSWYGRKQVGTMFFTSILFLAGTCLVGGSTNTILPAIAEQNGWDVNFLRSMAGVGAMFPVLGTFVFGTLIARKGAKLSIGISLIATAAFTVVYGYAGNITLFISMIFLIGFLSGGYQTSGANAMITNWWPRKKGAVLGIVTIGIVLVDIVWQPFIPMAFIRFGIGPTMAAIAFVLLIVAIVGIIFTKNTPEEAGEYPDGDNSYNENMAQIIKEMREYRSPFTFKKVLFSRATFDIGIGMGLLWMAGMTYLASIVPRLLSVGYDYNFALIVLAVCGGGFGILGSLFIGFLDQKFGTKRAAIIFNIMLLAGIVIALFHSVSVAMVWISSAIFSFAHGGMGNLIPSFVGTVYGRWDYPAAYRVIAATTQLFAGIGIMLTGVFHGNYNAMYTFDVIIIIISLIILINAKSKLIGKAG